MTSKDNNILGKTLWDYREGVTVENCMGSQAAKNNGLDMGTKGRYKSVNKANCFKQYQS